MQGSTRNRTQYRRLRPKDIFIIVLSGSRVVWCSSLSPGPRLRRADAYASRKQGETSLLSFTFAFWFWGSALDFFSIWSLHVMRWNPFFVVCLGSAGDCCSVCGADRASIVCLLSCLLGSISTSAFRGEVWSNPDVVEEVYNGTEKTEQEEVKEDSADVSVFAHLSVGYRRTFEDRRY